MNPGPATAPPRPIRRSALFIIGGDPRRSPRPSEAIRIAAGLAAWKRVKVTVFLRDAAVLGLNESVDDLVDADNFREGLPLLAGDGNEILAPHDSPFLREIDNAAVPFEAADAGELAARAAQSDFILRF